MTPRRGASLALALLPLALAVPCPPSYFTQLVDHFDVNTVTFQQRYYVNATSFRGAGRPILCILGGEGAVSPETGIYYPFVIELAARWGALIIEPEHRGYGTSIPTPPFSSRRLELVTPQQALEDAAALILHTQRAHNCSGEEPGHARCPVITIGGSYPGWLSAMMRLRYPNIVDAAYAASAPMRFYAQDVQQLSYYKVVTESAERASPGCPAAVRAMLSSTLRAPTTSKADIITKLNLCTPLPPYLEAGDTTLLVNEVAMVFEYTWADLNMGNYPPTAATRLALACAAIQAAPTSPWGALAAFFSNFAALSGSRRASFLSGASVDNPLTSVAGGATCYNMSAQLPSGDHATISSGDWSGVGSGDNGAVWDWETCTFLIEAIGTDGVSDMFVPRAWSMEWLNAHCAARFNTIPQPRALADLWGFDASRLPSITSRIIFTNGLNDGWSAGGFLTNLSDTLLAFNIGDGAHHSDLSHTWPSAADTHDVTTTRARVADTLAAWLKLE